MNRIIPISLASLLIAMTMVFAKSDRSIVLDTCGALKTGDIAPAFGGWTSSGKIFSIQNAFRDGSQFLVLSFFATWCLPCHEGLLILAENFEEFQKRRIRIVLVDLTYSGEREEENVRKFISDHNIPFETVLDKTGEIARPYGLVGNSLPKTFLINSEMKIGKIIGEEGGDFIPLIFRSSD